LPSFGVSLIPVYGSAKSSYVHFSHGNYGRGILYGALAISDVFLVKSLAIGAGRLAVKALGTVAVDTTVHVAEAGGARAGEAVLDANAVIGAFERPGELAQVEAGLAGRAPVVPITAAKEFLKGAPGARTLADRAARGTQLRLWLTANGGRIGAAASESDVLASQVAAGRLGFTSSRSALTLTDARVLLSAEREGLPLLTRDVALQNIAKAFNLSFEAY
jgi:hypothetical protein